MPSLDGVTSDDRNGDELDAVDIELDLEIDADAITAEEIAARRRNSSIEAGRRKAGSAGAAMAGAMLALSEIYEGPKRDEIVAVSETPDEPTDIDADGIRVDVGDVTVETRPPERDDQGS